MLNEKMKNGASIGPNGTLKIPSCQLRANTKIDWLSKFGANFTIPPKRRSFQTRSGKYFEGVETQEQFIKDSVLDFSCLVIKCHNLDHFQIKFCPTWAINGHFLQIFYLFLVLFRTLIKGHVRIFGKWTMSVNVRRGAPCLARMQSSGQWSNGSENARIKISHESKGWS